jgi:hypothetical protein
LKKIYAKNWSLIRFLVPFYDGDDESVIPVYESSFQFQGFIAQAREKLLQTNADYYFFISDDLILNPVLNKNNYLKELNLQNGDSLMTEITPLNETMWMQSRIYDTIVSFKYQYHTLYKEELKSPQEAFLTAKQYGLDNFELSLEYKRKIPCKKEFLELTGPRAWYRWIKTKQLPYPLLGGYSDWFIISGRDFKKVSQKLGVTAAMGLFVEIAIPTILLQYCEKVKTLADTEYENGAIWDKTVIEELEKKYSNNLNQLLQDFPEKKLYLHPIKLSGWSV